MMSNQVEGQIAIYLGALKKLPIYAIELVQDPQKPGATLRWGEIKEVKISKDDEPVPGLIAQMLQDSKTRTVAPDYQPEPLSEEDEQLLAVRSRVAITLEAFGRVLVYPTRHHAGGAGHGNPREGVRGKNNLSDFEFVKLARSL